MAVSFNSCMWNRDRLPRAPHSGAFELMGKRRGEPSWRARCNSTYSVDEKHSCRRSMRLPFSPLLEDTAVEDVIAVNSRAVSGLILVGIFVPFDHIIRSLDNFCTVPIV